MERDCQVFDLPTIMGSQKFHGPGGRPKRKGMEGVEGTGEMKRLQNVGLRNTEHSLQHWGLAPDSTPHKSPSLLSRQQGPRYKAMPATQREGSNGREESRRFYTVVPLTSQSSSVL
jgi:hypothetical protein